MASKLGFLLSLFFIIEVVAYGGDMCAINAIYTKLDALAVTVAYRIALDRTLTKATVSFVQQQGARVESLNEKPVPFGGTFYFKIYRSYTSLIISKEPMVITVNRTAVIGYLY